MAKKRNVSIATRFDGTQWPLVNFDEWLTEIAARNVGLKEFASNMLCSLVEIEQQRFDKFRNDSKLTREEKTKSIEGHGKRMQELLIAKILIEGMDDEAEEATIKAFELGRLLGQSSMRWMEEHAAVRLNYRNTDGGGRPKSDWNDKMKRAQKALADVKKCKPLLGETKAKLAAMKQLNLKSLTTFNTWLNGGS